MLVQYPNTNQRTSHRTSYQKIWTPERTTDALSGRSFSIICWKRRVTPTEAFASVRGHLNHIHRCRMFAAQGHRATTRYRRRALGLRYVEGGCRFSPLVLYCVVLYGTHIALGPRLASFYSEVKWKPGINSIVVRCSCCTVVQEDWCDVRG